MGTTPKTMGNLTISDFTLNLEKHDIYVSAWNAFGLESDNTKTFVYLRIYEGRNFAPYFDE